MHEFRRSDDDRALHDHPWESLSIVLSGRYIEHSIDAGGIHRRVVRRVGDVISRAATAAHRIEVLDVDRERLDFPVTLFLTGDTIREWGFHCPDRGWVHWRDFTDETGNTVGAGCDAEETPFTAETMRLALTSYALADACPPIEINTLAWAKECARLRAMHQHLLDMLGVATHEEAGAEIGRLHAAFARDTP